MFEKTGAPVLPHFIPIKTLSIHGNVHPGWLDLYKCQCTAEVEKTIRGSAKCIRNHRASQYDRFIDVGGRQSFSRLDHTIGSMCNDDPLIIASRTIVHDDAPVLFCHVETIQHHKRLHIDLDRTSAAIKHFFQMRVFEIELAGDVVVFLIECAAGDKYLNHASKV